MRYIPKFGYSLRGMQARSYQLCIGGKQLSVMTTTNGIVDVYITDGSVNGDIIQHLFIFPILLPFNGQNPCHHEQSKYIHHMKIIHRVGARLMYLPPYSPDLKPLEEVFAKVIAVLRHNDSAYNSTHSPEQ